jgi:hypothetical protein
MNEAIIRTATNKSNIDVILSVAPFPPTKKFKEVSGVFNGIVSAYVFSIAMYRDNKNISFN